MNQPHLVIIGGGLAGLSAGCYARRSGFRTTVVEHNLTLGGVCTAWQRRPYTIDGCIHWLTGGAFARVYEELGILERVGLRPLTEYVRYRREGESIAITADLEALSARFTQLAPEDAAEIERIRDGVRQFVDFEPPLDAPEITPMREHVHRLWEARGAAGAILHFRKTRPDPGSQRRQ
jgi:phytoene desaturase